MKNIPLGATCHYERINGQWYVVWGADFVGDESGRKLVPDKEALLLEMGYLYHNDKDYAQFTLPGCGR
jgi:hypothetical protein